MNTQSIIPITMPKWGLSMLEGKVVAWHVDEGTQVELGQEIMDIETEKIANTFEALDAGILRRKVAEVDETLPIGALLGVLAPAEVSDADIDAFIAEFQANYVPPDPDEEDAGPQYQFAEVGGCRIRYSDTGEGPVAVLIHGFGGDLDGWMFTQTALSANARVIAFDLPGHGQSGKNVTDGSVDALAATTIGLLDALGIDKAHLVGHSLGGAVAIAAAAAAPGRVASLSLIAPAGISGTINGGYLTGFVSAESRRELKPVLQQLVADASLITRSFVDDVLKFKRLDGVGEALTRIGAALHDGDTQRVDLRDALSGYGGASQVIWGDKDAIVPPPAEHPPGCDWHTIAGAGHLPQLEAAGEVNQLLSAPLK